MQTKIPKHFYGMLQDFATDNGKLGQIKAPEDIPWDNFPPGAVSHLDYMASCVVPMHAIYEDCVAGVVTEENAYSKLAAIFRDIRDNEQIAKGFFYE